MRNVNKLLTITICFFSLLITTFFSISPKIVLAKEEKKEKDEVYCLLCTHRNDDDPLYKKERQFYQKIRIIKDTYGDSIDEVALAAAVIHRNSGADQTYENEYESNFNESEYRSRNTAIKKIHDSGASIDDQTKQFTKSLDEMSLTEDEWQLVQQNEKYDLLTLAALVMVDSNKHGTYSDVCFRDGLAGSKLVGNGDSTNFLENIFNEVMNTITCEKVKQAGTDSYFSDNANVARVTEGIRIRNLQNVCSNGYVGGLYSGVKNIQDKEKQQKAKTSTANKIIELSNYYKRLYGKMDGNTCASNIAGATGDFANWKQGDSQWGNIAMGNSGSNIRAIGCLVTSTAIQIARSGTKIGNLPSGFSDFNPGAFVTTLNQNGGFDKAGGFKWSGFSSITPNWRVATFKEITISDDESKLANVISSELSSGYDGKYQKFLVIRITDSIDFNNVSHRQHWIAVNGVENGKVTTFDPAGHAKGSTLSDNYSHWKVTGYSVMYATDVMQGQTGTSSNNNCSGDSLQGIYSLLAYVEGTATCNYRGQGEGTGYVAKDEGDGAGITTALGITTRFDQPAAQQVGYTDFLVDSYSGCTNKEYIDKMLPTTLKNFTDYVETHTKGLNLSDSEKYVLASVGYGGPNLADNVIETIKAYGKESEEVYNCFKSYGCGFFGGSQFTYGLSLRRMAEYEAFSTGNFNAAKPEYLGSYEAVQNLSLSSFKATWPTKRETNLWDGSSGSSSSNTSGVKGLKCIDGRSVSEEDTSANFPGAENVFFNQAHGGWENLPYWWDFNNYRYTETVGSSGCGLTAMTMCIDILKGQNYTPKDVYMKRDSLPDSVKFAMIAYDADPRFNEYNTKLFGVKSAYLNRDINAMKEVLNKGGVILASSGNKLGQNPWHLASGKQAEWQHTGGHFVCIWAYRDGAFLIKDSSLNTVQGNNVRYTDAEMIKWNNNAANHSAIWAVYPA